MEVEDKARACERYADQLESLVQALAALRRRATGAWTGTAGTSLGEVVDSHIGAVRGAQRELRSAAGSMRAAARAQANQ